MTMNKSKHSKMSSAMFLESSLDLCVTDHDGAAIRACIQPTLLTRTRVIGIVEWEGTKVISSFVDATGDETRWGQILLLVWSATGPTSVREVPVLGPSQWSTARLTLPNITEPGKTIVSVCLTSRDWTARLEEYSHLQSVTEQAIPLKLRSLDVGSLAVDMLSRMLLGHSWLTGELMVE